MNNTLTIRCENPLDFDNIHEINCTVFSSQDEANLVDSLRKQANPIISLVAEKKGQLIGHIMFSPVTLGYYQHLR